jgi:hypothetical protein
MTNSDFAALRALARAKIDGKILPNTQNPKSVVGAHIIKGQLVFALREIHLSKRDRV